uniref:Glycoside hydrolase family 57 N-terminal domain-containing protein n=1 Tax=candidate division WOR-3 bacterium TaxID=2052148 RepID=A0A7V0Z7L0_UNCW3
MNNLSVAFLWHFHQPIYSTPEDKILPMPWVRLHAIKDYLDMLKNIQKFPDVCVTFNFTPTLLIQLQEYKENKCADRQFLLFRKRAEDLTFEEKIEILKDFFLANWEEMVEPYPRYFSLLMKRGKKLVPEELPSVAESFTIDEFRDLQIWANLAWIDPIFREEIKELYQKGRNFREQDKEILIELQNKIISSIFDEYKKAVETGQIELTTSPLAHPILPLLINSNLAKISNPNLEIPFEFKHPEDAREQIIQGIGVFEKIFGFKPKGLWPSEGSVCSELISVLSDVGIEWIATDEEILARSINLSFKRDENGIPNHSNLLYKPWNMGNIKIFFRDHLLSDRIAFVYNRWEPEKAVEDFIGRIKQIAGSLSSVEKFILPVILDGENAWEYFENDGTNFLQLLYKTISNEKIPTTTFSKFLNENPATFNNLSNLFPGSWIGANFNIWIGKPEDHKAWLIIKNLRDKLVDLDIKDSKIWRQLYFLEGSDWFWWFGDDFFSVTTEVFDRLFRQNALWIYKKLTIEPPHELFLPINPQSEIYATQPIDYISPTIDGKLTFFYEWYNAGYLDLKRTGGTMQRFAGLFSKVYYGFDDKNLYIRFDILNQNINQYEYEIDFERPEGLKYILSANQDITFKIDEIIEVSIPLSQLQPVGDYIEFIIKAREKGKEIDRTPLLKAVITQKDIILKNWTV